MTPWGRRVVRGGVTIGYSAWNPLLRDGIQSQARALGVYRRLDAVVRTLLAGQPEQVLKGYRDASKSVHSVIDQSGYPPGATPGKILEGAAEEIDLLVGLVANLYDGSAGSAVFVPDTNALLYAPQLEDWRFDEAEPFTLLLPTVLGELDKLKVHHRNESVRRKAEGLISRIKGYRARGRLLDGVPLRNPVGRVRARAVEPDIGNTLPWLDPANNDDRLVAGVVEVMREFPHSPVALVTRDLNLQNKAELAMVSFREPPSPEGAA